MAKARYLNICYGGREQEQAVVINKSHILADAAVPLAAEVT